MAQIRRVTGSDPQGIYCCCNEDACDPTCPTTTPAPVTTTPAPTTPPPTTTLEPCDTPYTQCSSTVDLPCKINVSYSFAGGGYNNYTFILVTIGNESDCENGTPGAICPVYQLCDCDCSIGAPACADWELVYNGECPLIGHSWYLVVNGHFLDQDTGALNPIGSYSKTISGFLHTAIVTALTDCEPCCVDDRTVNCPGPTTPAPTTTIPPTTTPCAYLHKDSRCSTVCLPLTVQAGAGGGDTALTPSVIPTTTFTIVNVGGSADYYYSDGSGNTIKWDRTNFRWYITYAGKRYNAVSPSNTLYNECWPRTRYTNYEVFCDDEPPTGSSGGGGQQGLCSIISTDGAGNPVIDAGQINLSVTPAYGDPCNKSKYSSMWSYDNTGAQTLWSSLAGCANRPTSYFGSNGASVVYKWVLKNSHSAGLSLNLSFFVNNATDRVVLSIPGASTLSYQLPTNVTQTYPPDDNGDCFWCLEANECMTFYFYAQSSYFSWNLKGWTAGAGSAVPACTCSSSNIHYSCSNCECS